MEPSEKIVCPVCGRPNTQRDQCTFCGSSLQEAAGGGALQQTAAPSASPPDPGRWAPSGQVPPPAGPGTGPGPWQQAGVAPRFAGFWIRTVAYLLDSLILAVIVMALASAGFLGQASGGGGAPSMGEISADMLEANMSLLNLLAFVVSMLYFTIFLGRSGQTPGKMVFGLRVIRADGSPPTYVQAAIRTLGYYLNHLTLCIGFLWVGVDRRKQGLHDKIAGTYEIHTRTAQPPNWPGSPPSPYGGGGPQTPV